MVDSLGILTDKAKKIGKNVEETKNGIVHFATLFLSFDIVNSTKYKSKDPEHCLIVIKGILKKIQHLVEANITYAEFWTTRGDEIIYFIEIYKKEEMFEAIDIAFSILNQVRDNILDGEIPLMEVHKYEPEKEKERKKIYQHTLSLKCASWITLTSTDKGPNKKYFNGLLGIPGVGVDFQGPDIDAGFRVIDGTTNRRMVLSFELASLLIEKPSFANRMYFLGFEKKKGVWNDRKYPIIWYHSQEVKNLIKGNGDEKTIETFEESFFYDEGDSCDITSKYIKEHYKDTKLVDILKKIEKDLSQLELKEKISSIKSAIEKLKIVNREPGDSKPTVGELHCVAIARSKDDKIFIAQREGGDFYDFGCVKITLGESKNIENDIQMKYLNDFGINIKVNDPYKTFYFEKKSGVIVKGFRFKAELIDENIGQIKHRKYKTSTLISKDDYKDFNYRDKDEFLGILKELFGEGE